MNQFDFSGKTCPEGFAYVPAKISEYLKSRRFDGCRAKKALKAVEPLIAEYNTKQACFGDFALFSLSMSSKRQTMIATLTTVAANEDFQVDDGRFEKALDSLIGRVEMALNDFYGQEIYFETKTGYLVADLDDEYDMDEEEEMEDEDAYGDDQ